jgi:hypothetical protein
MKQHRIRAAVLALAILVGGFALAQVPERNVSPALHPNLAAAQRHIGEAWGNLVDAQRANQYQLGGHAERAKELLVEASREIKLAAEASNRR